MEIGPIILGLVAGAGIMYMYNSKQEQSKENPSDLEILGLEERLNNLSSMSERSTPAYLQAPVHQPIMMPPVSTPYASPYYNRGIF